MERIPLLIKQKHEIYGLWMKYHKEHVYHRKRFLIEFCKENNCDIVLACDYLINVINDKIYCDINGDFGFYDDSHDDEMFSNSLGRVLTFNKMMMHLGPKESVYLKFKESLKNGNDHYVANYEYITIILSLRVVKEDIEILNSIKDEHSNDLAPSVMVEEINSHDSHLMVGCYDNERSKNLYNLCNSYKVFKFCSFKDFVNSLNNPDVCNISVNVKSQLYVLYGWFPNFYEQDYEQRIEVLNEKLGISSEIYSKKKPSQNNMSPNQKNFEKDLAKI